MGYKFLGIKQKEDNRNFVRVWNNIKQIIPKSEVDRVVDVTVNEVIKRTGSKNVGYAWSGGKDSLALEYVMDQAGIKRCVMGTANELDYPDFLKWVSHYKPLALESYDSGLTLEWLSQNSYMLFPKTGAIAGKWFKLIQHSAQDKFVKNYDLDMILLGRRRLDANYTGKTNKDDIYTNKKGITRYSPLKEWTHEHVMGVIAYYMDGNLPPIYYWPNGWVVGTGVWPARQWTGNVFHAWEEIYVIDPSIVYRAAHYLSSAKKFLQTKK